MNLHNLIIKQLEEAYKYSDISESVKLILKQPKNEIIVNFPVKLSSGEIKMFKGYRIQHNNFLGPYKGGLRYDKNVTLDECKALASWMTIKCALQNIPYGGGKGGLKFDPKLYSEKDLEIISKSFCKAINNFIGEDIDIPAPDMGTNSKIMDWMTYQYQTLNNNNLHKNGTFTGKSLFCGGSKGRTEATGFGVGICYQELFKKKNIDIKGSTYILQGFGNVGSYTSMYLNNEGAILKAVADHTGFYKVNEHNINYLINYCQKNKSLSGANGLEKIDNNMFWSTECDVLIPAALELQITKNNADIINCKYIIEAANGPTDLEAEEILKNKNILVVPDILANSGGVLVSYFEWLQNKRNEYWEKEKVISKLTEKMISVFSSCWESYSNSNLDLRTISYLIALENINNVFISKNMID